MYISSTCCFQFAFFKPPVLVLRRCQLRSWWLLELVLNKKLSGTSSSYSSNLATGCLLTLGGPNAAQKKSSICRPSPSGNQHGWSQQGPVEAEGLATGCACVAPLHRWQWPRCWSNWGEGLAPGETRDLSEYCPRCLVQPTTIVETKFGDAAEGRRHGSGKHVGRFEYDLHQTPCAALIVFPWFAVFFSQRHARLGCPIPTASAHINLLRRGRPGQVSSSPPQSLCGACEMPVSGEALSVRRARWLMLLPVLLCPDFGRPVLGHHTFFKHYKAQWWSPG